MEEKAHTRAPLVSRLPKYGTKPGGSTAQPVPNGTAPYLSGNTQIIDKNFSKHNGTARLSSFAFNWRKSNKFPLGSRIGNEYNSSQDPRERVTGSEKRPPSEASVSQEVLRTTSKTPFSKAAKQDNMLVSPAEEFHQKCLPGLSNSKYGKSSLLSRTPYSGFNAPKPPLNGVCGNQSVTGLQRIRGNPFVPRSSSGESLGRSTDNVPPSCEKMVRSQSFSHSLQSSLLPPASLTRSHSFNRAVDLTRPYQSQHLALRPSQRSNLLSRSARQLDAPNGNEPSRYEFPRSLAALAPSHVKKQSLFNGSGDASPLRFRSGRPSLLKPVSQPLGRKTPGDGSARKDPANSLMEDLEDSADAKRDADAKETQSNDFVESSCKMCMDGDVDEISISSLSSSEKNDLSEDFSDDFIDLEDPSRTILIGEEKVPAEKLEEVDDKSESAKHPIGNNEISSEMDYRVGSSFELSPSDSSDGTYMWDEEGLEPIGSVHPCGSYDSSEMNSIDILNNLESCDLEDDDLMLDVDLPEDAPYDNEECDNMNRYEQPGRNIRQQKAEGLWKRTPQRWNTQDHYHLSPTEHYSHVRNDLNSHLEGYGTSGLYPLLRGLPANTVLLDEMTLRHMVQDCTAVKTQLLKMKRILHQNDENVSLHNITLPMPSSPEQLEPEPMYKTEELLSEITQLKDDLKMKDETIQQLERRLAVKCGCHEGSKIPEATTGGFADKFTQTTWRRSAPQVLQPSSHLLHSADLSPGKLAKASPTVARSEPPPQDQPDHVGHEDDNTALSSGTDSRREPSTLNTQRNDDDSLANAHSTKNKTVREKAKDVASQKWNASQGNAQDGQARLAAKSHSSRPNQASPPKMSRALRAPKQTMPVPPPATSLRDSIVPPLSGQAQPQSVSNFSLASSRTQRTSKLRPPAISFRPKQRITSQTAVAPEQQRFQANPSKPLMPAKDGPQNRDPALCPGEGLTLHRHSRLPKPKT
ncbi:hypothetical protein Chor_013746 [Crotalus horridus]